MTVLVSIDWTLYNDLDNSKQYVCMFYKAFSFKERYSHSHFGCVVYMYCVCMCGYVFLSRKKFTFTFWLYSVHVLCMCMFFFKERNSYSLTGGIVYIYCVCMCVYVCSHYVALYRAGSVLLAPRYVLVIVIPGGRDIYGNSTNGEYQSGVHTTLPHRNTPTSQGNE